jgi:hypothetical protein
MSKKLITERELFNACNAYSVERRKEFREGERRSYLIIEMQETENGVGQALYLVDPSLDGSRDLELEEFCELPWRQQILIKSRSGISELIQKILNQIREVHQAARDLEMPLVELATLIRDTPDKETLKTKLKELSKGKKVKIVMD